MNGQTSQRGIWKRGGTHAVLGAIACLLFVLRAGAHDVPYSYIDLVLSQGTAELSVTAHIGDFGHDLNIFPLAPLLDPAFVEPRAKMITGLLQPRIQLEADHRAVACTASDVIDVYPAQEQLRLRYSCPVGAPAVLTVRVLIFPYDATHQTFLSVYEGGALMAQATLDVNQTSFDYYAGTLQGVFAVIRKFVPAGIHYILFGPDHLLFLFGLLLLGGSERRLLVIVTMFTAAHSITLSLSALNLVHLPPKLIEPAIALSIVYVGADNLMSHGARDLRHWMAFGFGFIHGFGFANALQQMDLPRRALGWALFSFNFGVEVGQVCVVIVVASALALIRSSSAEAGRRVAFAGSLVVIAAGAFWFVQRAFFTP